MHEGHEHAIGLEGAILLIIWGWTWVAGFVLTCIVFATLRELFRRGPDPRDLEPASSRPFMTPALRQAIQDRFKPSK